MSKYRLFVKPFTVEIDEEKEDVIEASYWLLKSHLRDGDYEVRKVK